MEVFVLSYNDEWDGRPVGVFSTYQKAVDYLRLPDGQTVEDADCSIFTMVIDQPD